MAVTRAGNTIVMTADADVVAGPLRIFSTKIVAGAGGMTINLRKGTVSGGKVATMVAGNSTTTVEYVEIPFITGANLYLEIAAGSGTVYLYLK